MADTPRKHLIHLHTSGTTLPSAVETEGLRLGEIAVQHNVAQPELIIATVVGAEPTFAHFIDSAAVDAKIAAASSAITSDISELQSIVSGYTEAGSIKADVDAADAAIAAEATARTEADEALDARLGSGVTSGNSATAQFSALTEGLAEEVSARTALAGRVSTAEGDITSLGGRVDTLETQVSALTTDSLAGVSAETAAADDYVQVSVSEKDVNNQQGISAKATLQAISGASASAMGLAEASDVKEYVDAVDAKLGAGVTSANTATAQFGAITQNISDLETIVGTGLTSSLTEEVAAVKENAGSALQSISAGTDGDFVTTTVGAKANNNQTVGVAVTTKDVSAATSVDDGLAVASDVKAYVSGETSGLSQNIVTIQNQLSGISTDAGAVKNYIDSKTSSVYVYKGSCAYAELPSSGQVIGDVWNVTDAHEGVPAGTNWAWNGSEWDPLAGSIDTSVFMTNDAFTGWTAGTYAPAISALTSDINDVSGDVTTLKSNVLYSVSSGATDYITVTVGAKDANKDQAISASAKTVAVSAATANADGLAIAYDVKQELAGVSGGVDAINAKIGGSYTSANTVHDAISGNTNNITTINQTIGSGFGTGSGQTVADQLAAVKTTADGAVQDVVISGVTGVSKSESDGVITFDFSSMVIDCGEY